jgi:hypothetical protein
VKERLLPFALDVGLEALILPPPRHNGEGGSATFALSPPPGRMIPLE